MHRHVTRVLQNRQHAGRLLAEKLIAYKNSDAIVLAVPLGGIPVGWEMANVLRLRFEIVFSKRIKNPAHLDDSIGAVTLDDIIFSHETQDIPGDYLSHQIIMLRRNLQLLSEKYGSGEPTDLTGRTAILVDDVVREPEELTTSLRMIQKRNPSRMIVATPVATSRIAHLFANENIRFEYLFMDLSKQNNAGTFFPESREEEVRDLMVNHHAKALPY